MKSTSKIVSLQLPPRRRYELRLLLFLILLLPLYLPFSFFPLDYNFKLRSFDIFAYRYRRLSQSPPFINNYHSPSASKNSSQVLQSLYSILSAADQNPPNLSSSFRITRGITCDPHQEEKGYFLLPPTLSTFCPQSLTGVAYKPRTEPPCLFVISNAFLGASGVLIHPSSQTVYDISGGCCADMDWRDHLNTTITLSQAQKRTVKPGRIVLNLAQHHGSTYHHVIHELVPRYLSVLPLAEEAELIVAVDESDVTPHLFQTLLGLPEHNLWIRPLSKDDWIYASVFLVPPPIYQKTAVAVYPPNVVLATSAVLRDIALIPKKKIRGNRHEKRKLILLERALSRREDGSCQETRCMKNFAELKKKIQDKLEDRFDIHVYGPRETVDNAVRLFSVADVVVGFHGAGFQNMMFCREGVTVVHIGWDIHYKGLADEFGLNYHLSLAKGTERSMRSIIVDVDLVVCDIENAIREDDERRKNSTASIASVARV